jgi:predicted ATPase
MFKNSYDYSDLYNFEFGLKNFKAFRELQKIDIKPLTIICGVNNCGKSSLIQSFLLMSQSTKMEDFFYRYPYLLRQISFAIEKKKYKTNLLFEGKLCHLSHFNNILNTSSEEKEIEFSYKNDDAHLSIVFFNPFTKKMIKAFIKQIHIKTKDYDIILTSNLDVEGNITSYNCKIKKLSIWRLIYNCPLFIEIIRKVKLKETYKDIYLENYDLRNIHVLFNGYIPEAVLIYPFRDFFTIIDNLLSNYIKNIEHLDVLKKIVNEAKEKTLNYEMAIDYKYVEPWYIFFRFHELSFLEIFCNSIHFIGPLREEPRRYYQFDDVRELSIGNKGENVSQILGLYGDSKIEKFKKIQINNGELIFEQFKKKKMTLLDGLTIWGKDLDLPEIKTRRIEQTLIKVLVKLPEQENYVSLQDVGFGISQILPVYVEALRIDTNDTLILEQPEIHLHPRMQSKLADFLLSMAASGKRFIIETHSEHLVNRICLRIAQDHTNILNELVSMVFVEPAPKVSLDEARGSLITKININKYGEVENWPVGFFDMTDHHKILRAGIEKRKKEKTMNKND